MRGSKSIITGGAGFIGSNLTDHLVRIGHKVVVLDNFVSGKAIKNFFQSHLLCHWMVP